MEFKEVIITFKAENEFFNKVIDWINQNDIFWLADLKTHFGVKEGSENFCKVMYAIDVLKKELCLQCCDVKASRRQYMAVKKISHRTIEVAKAIPYREAFNLPLPPKGTKVKTGKMYLDDNDKLTSYIFWLDCPDVQSVLFFGITSDYLARKIIDSFGWEADKMGVIPKLRRNIMENYLKLTVKEVKV